MKEIWKDIKGYEGLYQVSNLGRVKSLSRNKNNQYSNKEIILKNIDNGNTYLKVGLCKNGKSKNFFIHRLVAQAFVENKNKNKYNIINHIDNNPKNNIFNNLEWTDYKGNMQHCIKQGRFSNNKENLVHEGIGKKKVIRIKNQETKIYNSLLETEKDGFCRQHVRDCCNNKNKTHKGYIWKWYKEEN